MKAIALVGRNLKKARIKRNLTQENLSVDAGLAKTSVSGIERGVGNPTLDVLEALATALDIKLSELFAPITPGEKLLHALPKGRKKKR